MGKTCENCIHFCVCVYRDGTQINASRCAFYDQNKRPRGEWRETTHAVVCSNCGHDVEPRLFGAYMRYCCVCGSDNWKRGEAE